MVAATCEAAAIPPDPLQSLLEMRGTVDTGREVRQERNISVPTAACLPWRAWRKQGVFAGCETSRASPPFLSAKGSFLIRTSITLSICSKRIQLL